MLFVDIDTFILSGSESSFCLYACVSMCACLCVRLCVCVCVCVCVSVRLSVSCVFQDMLGRSITLCLELMVLGFSLQNGILNSKMGHISKEPSYLHFHKLHFKELSYLQFNIVCEV